MTVNNNWSAGGCSPENHCSLSSFQVVGCRFLTAFPEKAVLEVGGEQTVWGEPVVHVCTADVLVFIRCPLPWPSSTDRTDYGSEKVRASPVDTVLPAPPLLTNLSAVPRLLAPTQAKPGLCMVCTELEMLQ